jgi:hypothetical protein
MATEDIRAIPASLVWGIPDGVLELVNNFSLHKIVDELKDVVV